MHVNDTIDVVLADWCAPAAVAAAAMLACCIVLAAVEAFLVAVTGGTTWRWSPAPHVVRRLAFALCGVSLALPPAVAAATQPVATARHTTPPRLEQSCPPSCADRLTGLRLPDLPAREQPTHPTTLRVRPGDCLWTLAGGLLPPSADDAEISALTQAIYRANHDRIGPDPDLIFPGTLLTDPEATR